MVKARTRTLLSFHFWLMPCTLRRARFFFSSRAFSHCFSSASSSLCTYRVSVLHLHKEQKTICALGFGYKRSVLPLEPLDSLDRLALLGLEQPILLACFVVVLEGHHKLEELNL